MTVYRGQYKHECNAYMCDIIEMKGWDLGLKPSNPTEHGKQYNTGQ